MKKTFERNHLGKSTYRCTVCGKLTRETGHSESGNQQCAYCWEEGGLENSLDDGHISQTEFDETMAQLRKRYDRNADGTPKLAPARCPVCLDAACETKSSECGR